MFLSLSSIGVLNMKFEGWVEMFFSYRITTKCGQMDRVITIGGGPSIIRQYKDIYRRAAGIGYTVLFRPPSI